MGTPKCVYHDHLAVILPALLALACHSGSGSRDAARVMDVAGSADGSTPDSQTDAHADPADIPALLDSQADAPNGIDVSMDSGVDLTLGGDAGSDGAATFPCDFAGTNPKELLCERGQYCVAFSGGPVGSGTTFSCADPQVACTANPTCECLCGTGGSSNCSVPAYPYARCTCIPNPLGPVILCAGA